MSIERHRAEIEQIDGQIVALISKRDHHKTMAARSALCATCRFRSTGGGLDHASVCANARTANYAKPVWKVTACDAFKARSRR